MSYRSLMGKLALVMLTAGVLFSSVAYAGARRPGEMPAPRLLAPNDLAVFNEKHQLEFRWGTETGGNFDHYDFRLYKGTQTYEKNLILQKDIPAGTTSIYLDASQLNAGETYAWSLRFIGSKKSASSYSIFKMGG